MKRMLSEPDAVIRDEIVRTISQMDEELLAVRVLFMQINCVRRNYGIESTPRLSLL